MQQSRQDYIKKPSGVNVVTNQRPATLGNDPRQTEAIGDGLRAWVVLWWDNMHVRMSMSISACQDQMVV